MPCSDAMITNVITASPEQTVADALDLFEKHEIRSIPVVDSNNAVIGIFSFKHLLADLLPVSVSMDDSFPRIKNMNLSLDFLADTAPWVAKRLIIELPKKLSDVMIKEPHTVHSNTPLREGMRLLVKHGSPLSVVSDDDKNTLIGIISFQKVVTALSRIAKEIDKNNKECA